MGQWMKTENAGAGYCIYRGPTTEIACGKIPLGRTVEVYDAEVIGATEGLKAAVTHTMAKYATNVAVCLDNEEAAIRLHTGNLTPSSSKQIANFQELRNKWNRRLRASVASTGTVMVRWIPGHAGIIGNERADALAKSACSELTLRSKTSISRAQRLLNERYEANILAYWEKSAPVRYKYLNISMTGKIPKEVCFLSRRNLGRLLSARSGHGDFAAYHRRFKHENADLLCECGEENTPEHPFVCSRLAGCRKPQPRPSRGLEGNIKWTFGTVSGARAFGIWCNRAMPYG